jgi:hypothetical protein
MRSNLADYQRVTASRKHCIACVTSFDCVSLRSRRVLGAAEVARSPSASPARSAGYDGAYRASRLPIGDVRLSNYWIPADYTWE